MISGTQFIYEFHIIICMLCISAMNLSWELLWVSVVLKVCVVCVDHDWSFFWSVFGEVAPVSKSSYNTQVFPVVDGVISFGRAECLGMISDNSSFPFIKGVSLHISCVLWVWFSLV